MLTYFGVFSFSIDENWVLKSLTIVYRFIALCSLVLLKLDIPYSSGGWHLSLISAQVGGSLSNEASLVFIVSFRAIQRSPIEGEKRDWIYQCLV